MEDHACSRIRSTGILLEVTANVGLQDHLIDVLIHELLNVDLLRDLLGHFNSLCLDLSTCASTSLALPRLGRPSRQSQLCFTQHGHTGSTATTPEQPGNTSLCHVQMLLRYQDEKVLVWIVFLSCSCRVPVVFLWCLAALSVAWATHTASLFDGAGAPWVFTVTHQRDASSKQDDGDIRAPTLCGWM